MSSRFRSLVALAVLALAAPLAVTINASPAAAAPSVPDGFTNLLAASSLGLAVDLTDLPDGRMLVAAQDGQVWVIAANGTTVATPAVTLTGLCRANEQGLLGVDADPGFATNHFIYVYYTRNGTSNCENRVSRFTMTGDTAASEQILIDHIASLAPNHEGGDLQFGKDGYLYISSGDDANGANAQDLSNLAGKILRIAPGAPIPGSNPFLGSDSVSCASGPAPSGKKCQEIAAFGFRNPFRISADPNAAGTRIFVNDVGLDTAEEVDELVIGGNYGWPTREGFCLINGRSGCHNVPGATVGGFIDPLIDYTHAQYNPPCEAVIGGAFVPTGSWPAHYSGGYLYGDEVCGRMWALLPNGAGGWTNEDFASGLGPITSMRTVQQASGWAVYYTTLSGELRRISSNLAPGTTLPSAFHPLTPTRILDTRNGTGYTGRKPAAGDTISVKVTGGGSGVPNDAVAVAVNVTGTEANAAGYVTVWPSGESRPLASSLNFSGANDTAANAAIVRLGLGGQINLFTQNGAHLVGDVTGYWTETATAQAGRFVPVANPARLLDTRTGNGSPVGIVGAGGSLDLQVGGRGGIPSTGVSAVALTVTVTNTATSGFVTAWPTGATKPLASSVNPVGANDIRSNLVLLPLGSGGKISLYTLQATHLVVDVAGYFTDGSASSGTSGLLVANSPVRRIYTPGNNPFGRLNGGDVATVDYSTVIPSGAVAIVTNLTVDGTAAAGYLTAWPASQSQPTASNVNWSAARQTRAALAISSLASAGKVSYFQNVGLDFVVDDSGYFTA